MPGPQSVNRTQTPTAIQPPSVEMAPTPEAKPPSVGQIRDDASSAIHRMQQSTSVRGTRGMSMPQAVATLASAYDEGGIHAVNGALRENPALVGALGGHSREQGGWPGRSFLGGIRRLTRRGGAELTGTLRPVPGDPLAHAAPIATQRPRKNQPGYRALSARTFDLELDDGRRIRIEPIVAILDTPRTPSPSAPASPSRRRPRTGRSTATRSPSSGAPRSAPWSSAPSRVAE